MHSHACSMTISRDHRVCFSPLPLCCPSPREISLMLCIESIARANANADDDDDDDDDEGDLYCMSL